MTDPNRLADETRYFEAISKYMKKTKNYAELSVGIIKGNRTLFIGLKKVKGKWEQVQNKNSVFEIGSMTKIFTSALLANAVAEGLITLDQPVTEVLDFPLNRSQKAGKPVTFKTLANHTSGIPSLPRGLILTQIGKSMFEQVWPFYNASANPYKNYDSKKLENYLKKNMTLRTVPGEEFCYSNFGAGILGYLLERIYQKDLEGLFQEKLFVKYGMCSSTTELTQVEQEKMIEGRSLDHFFSKVPHWTMGALKGMGACLSTAEDLSRFICANFGNDPVLNFQLERTFDQEVKVALGWMIEEKENLVNYWHNGGTGGFCSCMMINPEHRQGVVVLSNIGSSKKIDPLCFRLMENLQSSTPKT